MCFDKPRNKVNAEEVFDTQIIQDFLNDRYDEWRCENT